MSDAVLVFDDDCGFCTWWVDLFAERGDLRVVGFSELDREPELREVLPEDYDDCSYLLTADRVYSCGAAMEEAFARSDLGEPVRPVIDQLRRIDAYGDLREWGYRRFSHNRAFWAKFTSKTPPVRRAPDAREEAD